jgi:hypothetical protein
MKNTAMKDVENCDNFNKAEAIYYDHSRPMVGLENPNFYDIETDRISCL